MKRKLRYMVGAETVEKDVNYIPVRFILAVLLAVLETLAVIAIVILLCLYEAGCQESAEAMDRLLKRVIHRREY